MAPSSGVLGRRPARGHHVARQHGEENAGAVNSMKNPGWFAPSGVFCIQESRPGIHLIEFFESCEDGFNLVEVASRGHFDARNHPPGNPAVDGSRADRQALGEFLFLDEGRFNRIHGYAASSVSTHRLLRRAASFRHRSRSAHSSSGGCHPSGGVIANHAAEDSSVTTSR